LDCGALAHAPSKPAHSSRIDRRKTEICKDIRETEKGYRPIPVFNSVGETRLDAGATADGIHRHAHGIRCGHACGIDAAATFLTSTSAYVCLNLHNYLHQGVVQIAR
jgi:hypothetical protein